MGRQDPYTPPVDQLLTLGGDYADGEPNPSSWDDYEARGLSAEHADELIRLATDKRLHNLPRRSKPEAWGPVHAWRALATLRAAEAVEPLLEILHYLHQHLEDEAEGQLLEEFAYVLALIGEPAIKPLGDFALDATRDPAARITASGALSLLGRLHPEHAPACAQRVRALLSKGRYHNPAFNSFVIADLVDLKDRDALELIRKAYEQGWVATATIGAYEEAEQRILAPAETE